jgi:hypothetical protein
LSQEATLADARRELSTYPRFTGFSLTFAEGRETDCREIPEGTRLADYTGPIAVDPFVPVRFHGKVVFIPVNHGTRRDTISLVRDFIVDTDGLICRELTIGLIGEERVLPGETSIASLHLEGTERRQLEVKSPEFLDCEFVFDGNKRGIRKCASNLLLTEAVERISGSAGDKVIALVVKGHYDFSLPTIPLKDYPAGLFFWSRPPQGPGEQTCRFVALGRVLAPQDTLADIGMAAPGRAFVHASLRDRNYSDVNRTAVVASLAKRNVVVKRGESRETTLVWIVPGMTLADLGDAVLRQFNDQKSVSFVVANRRLCIGDEDAEAALQEGAAAVLHDQAQTTDQDQGRIIWMSGGELENVDGLPDEWQTRALIHAKHRA